MFELISIVNVCNNDDDSIPYVRIDEHGINVRGINTEEQSTEFIYDRLLRTLYLFIIPVASRRQFLDEVATPSSSGHGDKFFFSGARLTLEKKQSKGIYVQGHVEVRVAQSTKADCFVVCCKQSNVCIHLASGKNFTCSVLSGSRLAVCGLIDKLSIEHLDEDSHLDLTDFDSFHSRDFSFNFMNERVHVDRIRALRQFTDVEETSRQRHVRQNIRIPRRTCKLRKPLSSHSSLGSMVSIPSTPSRTSGKTTFECKICYKDRRGRPVKFIPCNCKLVCVKCTTIIKNTKHSRFTCPFDRTEIEHVTHLEDDGEDDDDDDTGVATSSSEVK